jgi:DNA-binding response OmpR family regulator
MRIAVLDNSPKQTDLICRALISAGHHCHPFHHAKDLLDQLVQANHDSYDILILDWQVTDLSAVEVLRQSRDHFPPNLPVLFMTTRKGENDIVAGLAAGANDYLIKPIRGSELVARVQALLRRAYPTRGASEQIQFGRYTFETKPSRLLLNNVIIEVTQKEFELALLLFRNISRPLSRAYINEMVWEHDAEISSRTLDTHVSRVRSKLQLRPESGFRLAPVYGYGYRLEQLSE